MRWMEIAWAQVGVHETPGPCATSEIVGFFRDAGHPEVVSDETAWCAAFVGACLERAEIRCTRSLMARSYQSFGTSIDVPRIGAIAVFKRGSDPSAGHVGFVAGWTESTILVLGGNQSDAVNTKSLPRSDLLALRWPGEAVTADELVADGSRIAAGAQGTQKDGVRAGAVLASGELIPQLPGVDWLKGLAEQMQGLRGSFEMLEQFLVFASGKGKTIAIAFAIYYLGRMAWRAGWIKAWRAEDASTGKTGP